MSRFDDRYTMSPGVGETSTVNLKWFDPVRGFGFATSGGQQDVFLHSSVVQRAGAPALYPGAELKCEVGDGPRGKQVMRIVEVISAGDPDAVGQGGGGQRDGAGSGFRNDRPRQNRDFGDRGAREHGTHEYGGGERGNYGDRQPRNNYGDRDGGGYGDRARRPAPQAVQPYFPDGSEVSHTGAVKWFKDKGGYGFASSDDGSQDIFIHRSCLMRSNLHDLQPGQRVKMLVRKAEKGLEAVQLEILEN